MVNIIDGEGETFYIEGFHQSEGRKSLYLQNFKVRNITDGAGVNLLHCIAKCRERDKPNFRTQIQPARWRFSA